MTTPAAYAHPEPERAEIDAMSGPTLIEFGSPFCHWCIEAQSLIASALEHYPAVRHIRVHDGRGRPLGRSFGVKLWPTLVVLSNGKELDRLVRPGDVASIETLLSRVSATSGDAQR